MAHYCLPLLYPAILAQWWWLQPQHLPPDCQHSGGLEFLAHRRPDLLVRSRHYGPLSHRPLLHAPHPAQSHLAVATHINDCMVFPGTRLAPALESRRSCGNLLEPHPRIPLRHQCGRVGESHPQFRLKGEGFFTPFPSRARLPVAFHSSLFTYFHPLPLVLCLWKAIAMEPFLQPPNAWSISPWPSAVCS